MTVSLPAPTGQAEDFASGDDPAGSSYWLVRVVPHQVSDRT
jgi:hypothetical protein